MDSKDPETRQEYLQILRDTLARIEREPDPYFSPAAHAEFKRILTTRIATLERIALLQADTTDTPPQESGFRVQVHIRGVEILSSR